MVAPPANKAPTAAFTSTAANLAVSLDGSGSADSDGTIAAYAWDFGDSSHRHRGNGVPHLREAGTYTVTLTVTDDDGATGTVSRTVTVTAPAANTVVAADSFGRTVTGGFGTADTGGAWAVSGGNTSFAVNNGTGAVTLGAAGASRSAFLNSVSSAAFDGTVTVSADKIANGGGMFVSPARPAGEQQRLPGQDQGRKQRCRVAVPHAGHQQR